MERIEDERNELKRKTGQEVGWHYPRTCPD